MLTTSHWQIWFATGGILGGHNLMHVLAGGVIACVFAWLLHRRTLPIRWRAACVNIPTHAATLAL